MNGDVSTRLGQSVVYVDACRLGEKETRGGAYQRRGDAIAGILHLDCYATRIAMLAVSGDLRVVVASIVVQSAPAETKLEDALRFPTASSERQAYIGRQPEARVTFLDHS